MVLRIGTAGWTIPRAAAISGDGLRLAALDVQGECHVADITSGEVLWRRTSSISPAGPQFSSDCLTVLVPNFQGRNGTAIVSTDSGEQIAMLSDGPHPIMGLSVADGQAFTWDRNSTITQWDLVSRKIVRRITPSSHFASRYRPVDQSGAAVVSRIVREWRRKGQETGTGSQEALTRASAVEIAL